MKRVLFVALGSGLLCFLAGIFIAIVFARDQGLVLLAAVASPLVFVVGFALGFVWEARRQRLLNAQRVVLVLYIVWAWMSLYYFYFHGSLSNSFLFGVIIVQTVALIAVRAILMLERSFRELPAAKGSRQKIIAVSAMVMTAMLAFPPYGKNLGELPLDFESGYVFILNENFDASTHPAIYFIDTEKIALQWLLVCGISCLYYFFRVYPVKTDTHYI